jgi:hypothetical protein
MIPRVLLAALLAAQLKAQPAPGKTLPPRASLSCVQSLFLPTTGRLAAHASGSGRVRATVTIGPKGDAVHLDTDGGDNFLKAEVMVAVEQSQFRTQCAGKKVVFDFDFTIVEEYPTDDVAPPLVRFVPPNRFELAFRRVKPIIDMPPAKEPLKDQR